MSHPAFEGADAELLRCIRVLERRRLLADWPGEVEARFRSEVKRVAQQARSRARQLLSKMKHPELTAELDALRRRLETAAPPELTWNTPALQQTYEALLRVRSGSASAVAAPWTDVEAALHHEGLQHFQLALAHSEIRHAVERPPVVAAARQASKRGKALRAGIAAMSGLAVTVAVFEHALHDVHEQIHEAFGGLTFALPNLFNGWLLASVSGLLVAMVTWLSLRFTAQAWRQA